MAALKGCLTFFLIIKQKQAISKISAATCELIDPHLTWAKIHLCGHNQVFSKVHIIRVLLLCVALVKMTLGKSSSHPLLSFQPL